eukprot:1195997-Prorocentrum_minimum.AAC.3
MVRRENTPPPCNNISPLYGSSCANNGKDALNTPETLPIWPPTPPPVECRARCGRVASTRCSRTPRATSRTWPSPTSSPALADTPPPPRRSPRWSSTPRPSGTRR